MNLFTLQHLPAEERPRERLLGFGAQNLSVLELLELVLSQGTSGQSVNILAQRLLTKFASLKELAKASLPELMEVSGIGRAKASQLKAVFELSERLNSNLTIMPKVIAGPEDVYFLIKKQLRDYDKEHFFVITLNIRSVAIHETSVGILDATLVHPREVFKEAIKNHAASIIVAHNHPSGNSTPSLADLALTKRLKAAGQVLGISLRDHVIITDQTYFSFNDEDLL